MANNSKKSAVSDQVEESLAQQIQNAEIYNWNAETHKEVNDWILKNPAEFQSIKNEGAELYFRKEVLRRIRRQQVIDKESEIIAARLESDAVLRQRVDDKLRNVPLERLDRARVAVTKKLLAQDALAQSLKTQSQTQAP